MSRGKSGKSEKAARKASRNKASGPGTAAPAPSGRGGGARSGGFLKREIGGEEFQIDTGTARFEPDPYSPSGWLLWVNGVQSSHVSEDPLQLEFEYMQWIAAGLTERFDDPAAKLNFLHLGGGACSLPRWSLAAYPNSRSLVVELDARLAEAVREQFDLPRAPRLRIRAQDAALAVREMTPATRDVVIRDVFAGSTTPHSCITVEFLEQVSEVLTAGGVYAANIGDKPDLVSAKQEIATTARVFPHLLAIADAAMFKGRRAGNIVLLASHAPLEPSSALARTLLGSGVPAQAWEDAKVRAFCAGAEIRQAEVREGEAPQG